MDINYPLPLDSLKKICLVDAKILMKIQQASIWIISKIKK